MSPHQIPTNFFPYYFWFPPPSFGSPCPRRALRVISPDHIKSFRCPPISPGSGGLRHHIVSKPFKCPPVSPGSGGLHHHIGSNPFGAPRYLYDPGGSVITLAHKPLLFSVPPDSIHYRGAPLLHPFSTSAPR